MSRTRAKPKRAPHPQPVQITVTPATAADEPEEVVELEHEAVPTPPEVEEAFAGLTADTPIEIWRVQEATGEMGLIGRMQPIGFSAYAVGQRWGGGKYKAWARIRDKKTGQIVDHKTRTFSIDPDLKPSPMAGIAAVAPVTGSPPPHDGMAHLVALQGQVLQAVTASMASMVTAVTQVRQDREPAPPPDPLVMLDKVGAIVEKIMPKVAPPPPPQAIKEVIAGIHEVMDLKERMEPEAAPTEDPVLGIVKENLPRLLGILEQNAAANPDAARTLAAIRQAQALPPNSAAAAVTGAAPAPAPGTAAPPLPTHGEPPWKLVLARRKAHWVSWAMRDRDPIVLAHAEYEEMSGTPFVGLAKAFLSQADSTEQVVAAFPELTPYAPWVQVFLMQIREDLGLVPEGTAEKLLEGTVEGGEDGEAADEPVGRGEPGADGDAATATA